MKKKDTTLIGLIAAIVVFILLVWFLYKTGLWPWAAK